MASVKEELEIDKLRTEINKNDCRDGKGEQRDPLVRSDHHRIGHPGRCGRCQDIPLTTPSPLPCFSLAITATMPSLKT